MSEPLAPPPPTCPTCGSVLHRHPADAAPSLRWHCRECQWTWTMADLVERYEKAKAAKGGT